MERLKTADGSARGKRGCVMFGRGWERKRESPLTKTANETENNVHSHNIGQVEQSETKRDSG